MNWIVGRKYLHKRTSLEYECIAMTKDARPILERPSSGTFVIIDVLPVQMDMYTMVEEEKNLLGYINIYGSASDSYGGDVHPSKSIADNVNEENRLACVAIYEGDGL